MKKAGLLYVALLSLVGALVLAASGGAAETKPIKAAWIYVGPHNDGGWSQAHDDGRLYVQKMLGQERRHDVQGERPRGPADAAGDRRARARRQQDHLRHVVRLHGRDGAAAKKYPDVYFEHATGFKTAKNFANYFGARRGRDLPRRHGGGSGDEERERRVHRAVPDPRDHPAHERLRARRARRAARREDPARLDEVVVRPGEGAQGGREPRRGRAST